MNEEHRDNRIADGSTPDRDAGSWFEQPRGARTLFIGLIVACLACLIGGELVHKHMHFEQYEGLPGFYALVGFLAYCSIIAAAVGLRKILKRGEDYYDD